ncbi:MAG TPA: DUF5715 family protein [Longimicrobium sp.]|jgi:hypothetical protein|uniref:DUF5715 family protein n=1 Tax=Longimicrobium sp. TaxID=2029185 RepID=UPI002EDB292F
MKTLRVLSAAGALGLLSALPAHAKEPTLRGSPASMVHQHDVAKASDYSFLRDAAEVRRLAAQGYLVRIRPTDNYRLARVSHPYARPEVATFLDRLSAQYRDACGERLVVTSLTRPTSGQPRNAHKLSVHPAGMAADLRISTRAQCRAWLEGALLGLEARGVLDVTRERMPPHYHVAVFPGAYSAYLERIDGKPAARASFARTAAPRPRPKKTAADAPAPHAAAARLAAKDDYDSGVLAVLTACVLAAVAVAGRSRRMRRA